MYHFRIVIEEFGFLTDKNGYSVGDYIEMYTDRAYTSTEQSRVREEFERKYGRRLPSTVKLHQIPID